MRLLVLFLVVLCSSFAFAEPWYVTSEEIDITLEISDSFTLVKESNVGTIQYVTANLSLFPRESSRQDVKRITRTPTAPLRHDVISYRWEKPNFREYFYGFESEISTRYLLKEVTEEIPFPLESVAGDFVPFTLPSPTIDSDHPAIIEQANLIAQGNSDLYLVVHDIAEWTRSNIDYNLSTLTADVSKEASWVLANRKGVCDELTNLFVAMLRSLGIPARFVSGISYTESPLFPDRWGPHGWAEVYFPGVGWVDYDITYGEFGYLDPTHIKLKDGLDATTPSSLYRWLGRNVDLVPADLQIQAEVLDYRGYFDDGIEVTMGVEEASIGFNSYNLITARIENMNDYYVSKDLVLHPTQDVTIHDEQERHIALRPLEAKQISWLISIGDLRSGFKYTFPLSMSDIRNQTWTGKFTSLEDSPRFSEADMKGRQEIQKADNIYASDVGIACSGSIEFASGEDIIFMCTVSNIGNTFLSPLDICLLDSCETMSVGISQNKSITLIRQFSEIGSHKKDVTAVFDGKIIGSDAQSFVVKDFPRIKISDFRLPSNLTYGSTFQLSFVLDKQSFANPENVEITLLQSGREKEWELSSLTQDQQFVVDLESSDLIEEETLFDVIVSYQDSEGNSWTEEISQSVVLTDLRSGDKAILLAKRLSFNVWFRAFLVMGIVFAGLVLFVFVRRRT